MTDKLVASAAEAVADITSGMTLAVGGFGLCGIPSLLIGALADADIGDLEIVSNNCGVDEWGLGLLLHRRRIRRIVASHVGENKEFARQYLAGELEVELTPQGTRPSGCAPAAAASLPSTPLPAWAPRSPMAAWVPWRYHADGSVAAASPAKPTATFTAGSGGQGSADRGTPARRHPPRRRIRQRDRRRHQLSRPAVDGDPARSPLRAVVRDHARTEA